MSRKDIEQALARGVEALAAFFPSGPRALFPILSSVCVWAVRRVFNYRDHLLAWKVWLDPEMVRTKPDDFILHFFENDPALSLAYAAEIESGEVKKLRAAFPALYPVVGLEDAFLRALFREELAAGDPRAIAAGFEARVAAAVEDLKPAEADPAFWRFLETFGMELASLGIHLLKDKTVQGLILAAIKAKYAAKDDDP